MNGKSHKSLYLSVLGVFTLLSIANLINATIKWFEVGPTAPLDSFLISGLSIPIYIYTLISIIATVAFFAGFSYIVATRLSAVDQIYELDTKINSLQAAQEAQRTTILDMQDKIGKVDENIDQTSNKLSTELSSQGDALKKSWTAGHKVIDDKATKIQAGQESQRQALMDVQNRVSGVEDNLELTGKKLAEELSTQSDEIKQAVVSGDENQQKLIDGIQGRMLFVDESLNDIKKELAEQAESMKTIDDNVAKNIKSVISKQKDEISEIKQRLERLEESLVIPEAMLNSDSSVEDVKGIGPNKATELTNAGIVTASDFIMADPKVAAQALGSTEKTTEKLQGRAQLQMIPGIEETDLSLLEELDITDRASLSTQDPIDLGRKINAIFKEKLAKGKVEENARPSIEDIISWIKDAKN